MLSPLFGQLSPLRVPTIVAAPLAAPASISGLQLWLDADDGGTLYDSTSGGSVVTTNGAAVARWQDKSGNNNHYTQTTANARPVLQTSSLNSKNGLLWDGSNDFMSGSVAGFRSFTAATIVLVFRSAVAAAADAGSGFLFCFGNIGDTAGTYPANRILFLSAQTGLLAGEKITYYMYAPTRPDGRLGSSTYSRAANQAVLLSSSHSSSGTVLKQNGASVSLNLAYAMNTATNTAPSTLGWTVDDVLHLGAIRSSQNLVPSPFSLRFYEVLVFDKVLTAQEEQDLNAYLNNKWSLY